jgi:hypothetical protein
MSLETFIFKRIDQLIIFVCITVFFVLIMYFKITPDEEDINKNINSAFINICDVDGIDPNMTMGKFQNMYCNSEVEDSLFAKIVLTFKLLYTSSYIYNINILNFLSSVLTNQSRSSPSSYKMVLIILYAVVYYLYLGTMYINNQFIKLVKMPNNKPKKRTRAALGQSILNSLKSRLISFIFYIISISIIINVFTYVSDIVMGMAQASRMKFIFFVIFIVFLPVLLTTGIFNIKLQPSTNGTICKNNNKYLVLLFILMIPIITGIRQFTTIVGRGFYNMFNSKNRPSLTVLFKTIFIMVLVLFNFDLIINLGKKNQTLFS